MRFSRTLIAALAIALGATSAGTMAISQGQASSPCVADGEQTIANEADPDAAASAGAETAASQTDEEMHECNPAEILDEDLDEFSDKAVTVRGARSARDADSPSASSEQDLGKATDVVSPTIKSVDQIGHGWPSEKVFDAGNFDGQGADDVMLVRTDRTLMLYPRTDAASFSQSRKIGHGWDSILHVLIGIDFDGDHRQDVLGVRSDGRLMLYQGSGQGGFRATRQVGTGWSSFDRVVAIQAGPGGKPALIAFWDDMATVYPTNGTGAWLPKQAGTVNPAHGLLFPGGDLFGTGYSTLIRLDDEGTLAFLSTEDGITFTSRAQIATSFNSPRFAQTNGYGDNGLGTIDVVDGQGRFLSLVVSGLSDSQNHSVEPPQTRVNWPDLESNGSSRIGHGWPSKGVYSIGDFDRNGFTDLAIVNAQRSLVFYP